MVRWELLGIGALAHRLRHTLEGINSLLREALLHHEKDVRQNLRIVRCAVVVEILQLIMLGNRIQLMILQFGVDVF